MEHRRINTSCEVFAVLYARHREELTPFCGISEPEGGHYAAYGDPCCRMMTEWGLRGSPVPLIGHENRWKKDPEEEFKRTDETHEYWLCVPLEEDES